MITTDLPKAMRGRPVDHRGYPVPWFATEKDEKGRWDFTRITPERWHEAARRKVCWVSGEGLGRRAAFIFDDDDVARGYAIEPPMKPDVARWAMQVCPFLARGTARPRTVTERTGAQRHGPDHTRLFVGAYRFVERGWQFGEGEVTVWSRKKPAQAA